MSSLSTVNSFLFTNPNVEYLTSDSDESNEKAIERNFFSSTVFSFADSVGTQFNSSSSTKSQIEKLELHQLTTKAERKADYLVSLSIKEEFVEGEVSTVEIYLESLYRESPTLFLESFQKCWLKLYALDNPQVLADFISIISSLDYEWLTDKADVLVLSGCAHSDPYVNEATLRAIEAWEKPSHVDYLNNVRQFELDWLENYKMEVLNQIKGCNELPAT